MMTDIERELTELKYINTSNVNIILDSLTKVINRQYIIQVAKSLIRDKVPFTLMILDIDNFKQINDSFGHLSGDYILNKVGEGLIEYGEQKVYIGRFGGDEFLLIFPNVTEYSQIHELLEKLYQKGRVFRRYYNDGFRDIYLTATVGCASYPKDALTYEDLFSNADKALYRGKTKGRNCYIIYVETKHKNIEIKEKAEGSLVVNFKYFSRLFDIYMDKKQIIKHTIDYLYTQLHCSGAYFITQDNTVISSKEDEPYKTGDLYIPHIEMILNGDKIFHETPLLKYKNADPVFGDYAEKKSIQSIIISKLYTGNFGYIVIVESEISRIWQDQEVALVMYATALLELRLTELQLKESREK